LLLKSFQHFGEQDYWLQQFAAQFDVAKNTSMSPSLRPYQIKTVKDVYACIGAGYRRILCVAPTGSGKTVISAQIVSHAFQRVRKVLFLIHRDALLEQTSNKFKFFNIESGFIKSGHRENRQALIQIASVQTLARRDWWQDFEPDLIVFDECHLTAWSEIARKMMDQFFPEAIYLGLTATPWRLSKTQAMGDIFEALVCAPMPYELIEQGYLVKPCYFGLAQADLDRVGTISGDFDESELAIVCDQPELVQNIVKEWQRIAYGRRTIVFAVNVAHSKHLCESFQSAGISSAHVDGSTPLKERDRIYAQLAAGEILVLCSCQALTEGFDCPSVSAILLCRPTQSRALYMQMIGRGLRLCEEIEKRDCVVLDQSGNVQRFGFIEDLEEITLEAGESPDSRDAPMKQCPPEREGCGAMLYAFQMQCPQCQYEFFHKKIPIITALESHLSPEDQQRRNFYRVRIKEGFSKKYLPSWAVMAYKDQFGHWPPFSWALHCLYGESPGKKNFREYYDHLNTIAERKDKDEEWIQRQMLLEFGYALLQA
jgi:superfamily II DNA or RNA helicase